MLLKNELKKLYIKQYGLVVLLIVFIVKLLTSADLYKASYSDMSYEQQKYYLGYMQEYGGQLTDEKETAILSLYSEAEAAKQLQNSNNGLHSGQPPNIHSRTGAENHLTEVYNTIALSLFQVHFTKNICQSLTLFIEQMFAFQKKLWYTDCEIHCSGAAAGSCQ